MGVETVHGAEKDLSLHAQCASNVDNLCDLLQLTTDTSFWEHSRKRSRLGESGREQITIRKGLSGDLAAVLNQRNSGIEGQQLLHSGVACAGDRSVIEPLKP